MAIASPSQVATKRFTALNPPHLLSIRSTGHDKAIERKGVRSEGRTPASCHPRLRRWSVEPIGQKLAGWLSRSERSSEGRARELTALVGVEDLRSAEARKRFAAWSRHSRKTLEIAGLEARIRRLEDAAASK